MPAAIYEPTETQLRALGLYQAGHRRFCWAAGVGSGKSTWAGFMALNHSYEVGGGTTAIVAQSQVLARRIFIPALETAARVFNMPVDHRGFRGAVSLKIGRDHRFAFYGASDAGSERQIAGLEFIAAIVDEATLTDPEFYGYLPTRLRGGSERPLEMTLYNRMGLSNWIRLDVESGASLDGSTGLTLLESIPLENAHNLPDGYLERLESLPAHQKRRLVENVWCDAEGLVYPQWTAGKPPPGHATLRRICGVDEGLKGVMAAVLLEEKRGGQWYITREYYHDAREGKKAALSAREHAQRIIAMAGKGARYQVDPTAVDTKHWLRELGVQRFDADNNLEKGIGTTQSLLADGSLLIDPEECPNLVRELQGLTWNPRTEKPDTEADDHATDALRYAAMDVRRITLRIIPKDPADLMGRFNPSQSHVFQRGGRYWKEGMK